MKVQVKRQTKGAWDALVKKRGLAAEYVDVPGTQAGIKFRGLYTDQTRAEVSVAWPVDRPKEAQDTFAKEVCLGSEPVKEMEREVNRKGLSVFDGGDDDKLHS